MCICNYVPVTEVPAGGNGPCVGSRWPHLSPGGTFGPHVRCAGTSRGGPRRALRYRASNRCRWHGDRVSRQGFEARSEEHTSELQSRLHLVCRLLLEKKKKQRKTSRIIEHDC